MPKPRRTTPVSFPLGQVVATPHALESVPGNQVQAALGRHARGDWGDVCDDDWEANESALQDGSRLFSVYHTAEGVKFWMITEATDDGGNRSATTVLLPEDY